jgi:AraC-like DNA-binding protein
MSRVVLVREFIDRNPARPLPVERLGRMAGLSTFHFIRAFRAVTGQTPHQYLRARRIARAQEQLVSFRSLGSFSAVFRRLTGESPTAYRAARRRSAYIPACFVRMYRAE